jgi:hypothetical protein
VRTTVERLWAGGYSTAAIISISSWMSSAAKEVARAEELGTRATRREQRISREGQSAGRHDARAAELEESSSLNRVLSWRRVVSEADVDEW